MIINNDRTLLTDVFVYFKSHGTHYGILFYFVMSLSILICTFKSIFLVNKLFFKATDYYDADIGKTWTDTLYRNSSILILSSIGSLLVFMT